LEETMALNETTALAAVNSKTDRVIIRGTPGKKNDFNLSITATWSGTILILRRLEMLNENQENLVMHSGADGAAALTAGGMRGVTADELIGKYVFNETDNSTGIITDNTATVVTATLAGGTDNDFDAGDECSFWEVVKSYTSNASVGGDEGSEWAEYMALASVWNSGTARVIFDQ
jgi:hypothetical protein